jgi:hypothetical protein
VGQGEDAQATTSIAPIAPSEWPTMDLMELIGVS